MDTVVNVWIPTLERLRRSWREIFGIHLAFTALGVVLFAPLIGLTGRLLMRLSGQPALADQDIAYFLLSPLGILALIVFAALRIVILALEMAALMWTAVHVMNGRRIGTVDALLSTAARAGGLLLFAALLVARVLLLTLPFLAVAAGIAFFLITDYDINYYLQEKPPEFWSAAVLIGIVLIVMSVLLVRKLLSWSLALPLVLFGGVPAAQSFRESIGLVQGNRKQVFAVLVGWAAVATLLGAVLAGMIKLIGTWGIPMAGESISTLVVVLGGLAVLWVLGNFLVTTVTSGSFAYLVMGLYERYGPVLEKGAIDDAEEASELKRFRFTRRVVAITLIAGTVASGLAGAWLLDGIQIDDKVVIVAHRGASAKAPENTLAAARQAIEDKADWVEIDVQETADGEVVVMHDSDFMKLVGNNLKIWDATRAQLHNIDIGSWFGPSFSQERVPTLKELLGLAKGKVNVVIELKYYGHDQNLEQRVVEIVEQAGMVNETAVMSLNYDAVKKVHALRPDWNVGLLSATAIGDLSRLDADFLAVAMGMASGGFVKRAHEAGRQVFVWTVNDPVSMSRMMSLGVDGLITDKPEMARQVLADRANLSTVERLLIHTAVLFGRTYTPQQYREQAP
jgi:glycerophosphoryl diester phosphodiesterase